MTEPHSARCSGDGDRADARGAPAHVPLHRRKALWLVVLAKVVGVALALVFLREVQVRFGIAIALLHVAVIVTVLVYILWVRVRRTRV